MNDYAELMRRHRRIAILRFLQESPAYTSNVSILGNVLNSPSIGVSSSREDIGAELTWLAAEKLVTLGGDADFLVATATTRGIDVALGTALHPDVQRPSPRR